MIRRYISSVKTEIVNGETIRYPAILDTLQNLEYEWTKTKYIGNQAKVLVKAPLSTHEELQKTYDVERTIEEKFEDLEKRIEKVEEEVEKLKQK